MTAELLYSVLRFGSLALLWVLIGSAVLFLRHDITLLSTPGNAQLQRGRVNRGSNRASNRIKAQGSAVPPKQAGPSSSPRYLAFTSGALANKRVPLKFSPIILGRAPDCTVPIADTYASGHHVRLFKKDNQWFVEDLNSTNGTLINGARLQTATPLNIGVKVQIGQTTMELTR